MNTAGDAADQVVRYSLEAGEVALKLTGEGAKELAVLLYTILKEEKKTSGKAKLETLIRSGKPLTVFSVKKENLQKFEKEAKGYGIMYYPIPNSEKDGLYDIVVKEEDAPRINRLVERFKLTSVTEVSDIKSEVEKGRPERAEDDKLVDELLGKLMKKEEKTTSAPPLGKTEKSRPSETISGKHSRTVEGTSKKAEVGFNGKQSVREELQKIKEAREKEGASTKQVQVQKKENTRTQSPAQHTQPKSKRKKKAKER